MIQRLGTEILAGMKHDAWEISVIDRIREMLCFQADTGVLCVRNALFSRKLHWLVCDIKLQTRLVRKQVMRIPVSFDWRTAASLRPVPLMTKL